MRLPKTRPRHPWGDLSGRDVDLKAGTIRVRAAFAERSNGEIVLGPPKSRAGHRVVGIPGVIFPAPSEHLSVFSRPGPDGLVFPGPKGGPLRRGNFNRQAAWPRAVAAIGVKGLHFHDLRHSGKVWAATSGAGLRDLMVRMGHDSERAAVMYQHQAREPTRRSRRLSTRTPMLSYARTALGQGQRFRSANGTLMAHHPDERGLHRMYPLPCRPLTWAFTSERVRGIEPPLSAWEVSVTIRRLPADPLACGTLAGLTASDRESPSGLMRSGT